MDSLPVEASIRDPETSASTSVINTYIFVGQAQPDVEGVGGYEYQMKNRSSIRYQKHKAFRKRPGAHFLIRHIYARLNMSRERLPPPCFFTNEYFTTPPPFSFLPHASLSNPRTLSLYQYPSRRLHFSETALCHQIMLRETAATGYQRATQGLAGQYAGMQK